MPAERLPMRQVREVLRLNHVCGQSGHRIAAAIGISRYTACSVAWCDFFICRGVVSLFTPGIEVSKSLPSRSRTVKVTWLKPWIVRCVRSMNAGHTNKRHRQMGASQQQSAAMSHHYKATRGRTQMRLHECWLVTCSWAKGHGNGFRPNPRPTHPDRRPVMHAVSDGISNHHGRGFAGRSHRGISASLMPAVWRDALASVLRSLCGLGPGSRQLQTKGSPR
jgi:hypothetical protein